MTQKWYQKASVQVALVSGILIICGTVLAEVIHFKLNQKVPSHLKIDDVIVSPLRIDDVSVNPQEGQAKCIVDFRITNAGDTQVAVSRVRFRLIEHQCWRGGQSGYLGYTGTYNLNITNLKIQDDVAECIVSQVIEAGRNDRFGVVLVTDMGECDQDMFIVEPSLITNSGISSYKPISITFGR